MPYSTSVQIFSVCTHMERGALTCSHTLTIVSAWLFWWWSSHIDIICTDCCVVFSVCNRLAIAASENPAIPLPEVLQCNVQPPPSHRRCLSLLRNAVLSVPLVAVCRIREPLAGATQNCERECTPNET